MPEDNLFVSELDALIPPIDATLVPDGEIPLEESNTYNWNGASIKRRIGETLPVVYGRHVMAPTLINAFIEEGENETLNMLLAWCEGEIESITNLKINGNPIENLYGNNPADPYGESAEVSVRTGKINQTAVQGFGELHNVSPVETLLRKNQPIEFTGTINQAQAFRLELEISKLYQKDVGTENLKSWFFSVLVEIKRSDEQNYRNLGIIELNKKTTSTFKRYFKSEYLTPGLYDLRITKVSDDPDVGDGALTFGDVTLVSVDEITTEDLQYPTVSLTGLRLLSFQSLQGDIPNITGLVTGKKVRIPKVTSDVGGLNPVDWEDYYYDGGDGKFHKLGTGAILYWDGSTYYEAWTANPVWCLRDLLLSKRYGLGEFISESKIHDASFLAAALFCEEAVVNNKGNKEKRFRLDIVLDTSTRAPDVLAVLLRSFRGFLYQSENILRLTVEKQESPKALFTMGNIISSSFKLQYLPKKIPNVVAVDFTNKDKNYLRDQVEIASDEQSLEGVAPRTQNYQMVGATRITQIIREARILLNKLNNNQRVLSFEAFYDAVLLQPFDVIEFQHDVPSWGEGGRCEDGSTTYTIQLDKEVILSPGSSYELKLRNPYTDEIETQTVTNLPGVYSSLTVASPFSFTPTRNDIWALGVLGQDIKKYRITQIAKPESGRISITAIEYSGDVYDESQVVIPQDIYTHLILDVPNVQDLAVEEVFNKSQSGTIEDKLQVSFKIPPVTAKYVNQAVAFEVWLSDNGGSSWTFVGKTDKEFYLIPDMVSKGLTYTVAVVSVTENGQKNPIARSPQQSIQIQGFAEPPADAKNLRYDFTDEITLTWDRNTEGDILGYEIRKSDKNWLQDDADLVWRGNATKFIIVRPEARSGITYYLRAFNTSGIVSRSSISVEPVNAAPAAPTVFFSALFQKVFISWFPLFDQDIQHYEVWRNDEETFFGQVQASEDIVAELKGTSIACEVPFETTYFRVVAVDRFGRGSYSNVIAVDQQTIVHGDIGPEAIHEVNIAPDAITAPKIAAGSIIAGKIAAGAVVAENISVDNLSAISANLGKVISGEIVGALIKTSEDLFRVELDSIGMRAYDELGRQTLSLERGRLKFIDPANAECYSCLDAGQLIFHTPYGDIPYATRLVSGTAQNGSTVRLCQWVGKPEILLAPKRLTAYNEAFRESSQEWCIYHDNVRPYDFGGSNFGWEFDIHAELKLSGGTRAEEFFNTNFNVVRSTGSGTCSALVTAEYQLWCHSNAPDKIKYACLCYEVMYRKSGCGTWCSQCFGYLQPNQTIQEIKSTQIICHTIEFGEIAQWEVQFNERGRHYIDSNFDSGGFCCFICRFTIPIDCSFFTTRQQSVSRGGGVMIVGGQLFSDQQQTDVQAAQFQFPNTEVCRSVVSYTVSGTIQLRAGHVQNVASASVSGQYGGGASATKSSPYPSPWCTQSFSFAGGTASDGFIDAVQFTARATLHIGYTLLYDCAGVNYSAFVTNIYCQKVCCIINICACCTVCCFFGGPDCCNHMRFRSMRDITGFNCIVDPAGEINYLAVAYR